MLYFIGVSCAILSGFVNFLGQILQKKAINDIKAKKGEMHIIDLIKSPTWLVGFLFMAVLTTAFLIVTQLFIGPALVPGLVASGFIVLAIGSAKILGEKLKKEEYAAIAMLILAVLCLSFSKLVIVPDIGNFNDSAFNLRIGIVSGLLVAVWLTLFFIGKKSNKRKAIFIPLATAFPFIVANIWMQPFLITIGNLFSGQVDSFTLTLFFTAIAILAVTNSVGLIHTQTAMASGNASIVIPMMQIPAQLSPILIYFVVYALPAPNFYSYILLAIAIILAIAAGFLLSKRQTELEKLVAPTTS